MSHPEWCSAPLSSTGNRLASPQLFLSSFRPWPLPGSTTYSLWPQRPSYTWPSLRSVTTEKQTSLKRCYSLQDAHHLSHDLFNMAAAYEKQEQHSCMHTVYLLLCFLFFLQLMLGVPEQALSVLHEAIEPVLAHGSLMDKGRALLLTARCQMAVAGFRPNGQGQAGNSPRPRAEHSSLCHGIMWLLIYIFIPADLRLAALAVDSLNETAAYFSQLSCKERLRDVHYLQALLHRSLGQTSQCNRSAMLFRLLDQELQSPAPPVSMRL